MNSFPIPATRWREQRCLWKLGQLPVLAGPRPRFLTMRVQLVRRLPRQRAREQQPRLSPPDFRLVHVLHVHAGGGGAGRHFRPGLPLVPGALQRRSRQRFPPRHRALATAAFRLLLPQSSARQSWARRFFARTLVRKLGLDPPVRKHQHHSRRAEEAPGQADSYQLLRFFLGA